MYNDVTEKVRSGLNSRLRMSERVASVLALLLALFVVAACGNNSEPASGPPTTEPEVERDLGTIVEIASSDESLETLVVALQSADLVETLSGAGPFTVFAPTDEAFDKLPAGTLDALLADVPMLANILLYHVVSGNVMAADVVALDSATTVQGDSVSVQVEGDTVRINDAQVVTADIEASNGTIHIIDAVLMPPVEETAAPLQTIVEIAVGDGRFETLVAALQATDLFVTLSGTGPFTVFAPTDDAFAKLPAGTVESLLDDVPALNDILLYHVVDGNVMAADVATLDMATTLQGEMVNIAVDGETIHINEALIVISDIEASNGTIHVIDSVLLPPAKEEETSAPTIVEIAVGDGRFETLVAALQAADLVETLAGPGPFTVFAPTDDAFAKLPAGTVEALLGDIPALTDILLYHVIAGSVMAADVVTLDTAATVQGQSVAVSVEGDTVLINESQVVTADIEASNGTIHVIDTVLIPAEE